MSTLTPDQWQSRDNVPSSEAIDMKDDNATDFAKFIEAQSPITGSTGAREMLKAGQRRLRQLAQRQRKNTDPKTKAEESARQLLALQEGGFLPSNVPVPAGVPKRSGHKKSLDSSRSSSRSISNLSFRSSSRRDVESIGQPWLTDPLEKKDRQELRANHLSALDLRELTSLVEAAVSLPPQFDDANPPPYQPPTPAKDPKVEMQGVDQNPTTASDAADSTSMRIQVDHCGEQESDVLPAETGSNDEKALMQKNQAGLMPDEDTGLKVDSEAATKPSSSSSGSLPTPTSQSTLSLKLFPDTIPPRNPSRGAWRISNARPLALNRPLPAAPTPERTSTDSNTDCPQPADSMSLKEDRVTQKVSDTTRSASFDAGKPGKEPMASPVHEKSSQKKSCRRPSSLPMCTIEAFPLPAPMRPLPSLPESTLAIDNRRASGKSAPVARLVLDGKSPAASAQDEPAKSGTPVMSGPVPPVRTGQSRAERVHALKMRDMSASRLYLRDSETPQEVEEDQPVESAKSPQEVTPQERLETRAPKPETADSHKRYQRKVASDPPSPPPVSPPPSKPSRQLLSQSIGRRYCTTPIHCSATFARETESQGTVSSRGPPIRRASSTRSTASSQGRANKEQNSMSRAEIPIPSSDDECTSASAHQDRARPVSGKRRRMRPTPLTLTEPASHKGRATKRSSSDHAYPFTPKGHRSRVSERSSPRSHLSHSTYYSQDSRSSHRQSSEVIRCLEERIAHLERQNKVLQAALLAALDVGVKDNLESVLGGSATSLSTTATTPATGSSFSSTTHSSSLDESMADECRRSRRKQPPYRPTSWIASPESSRRSSYDTGDSDHVRELEDMIEDMDFDWMSDKSDAVRV
ncbi:uncharacterized protein BO80DRAFT_438351 [Aspergillus ibericus CBS 121593]|uniref:Uncharacterized protein n=1 Tax=Aspergillus ibericus CBS 121593 TaxID=1448316 RepID=A0A395GP14_9EURO|nr:hypothetical protein BO80DRAFT_438351 [Aspergillus ibericus CBS 121593]RAK96698.1 hypothetical protein BO80DRAFT_438351 [Aspergillus ibericus CBS 121593]